MCEEANVSYGRSSRTAAEVSATMLDIAKTIMIARETASTRKRVRLILGARLRDSRDEDAVQGAQLKGEFSGTLTMKLSSRTRMQ
jgi:hypothetical protein